MQDCCYFMTLEIYLVGLYLASVLPQLCQVVLAEDRTDQEKSLHFPCLQVATAIPAFHRVLSHSQVTTKCLNVAYRGEEERGERGRVEIQGEGSDICDNSFVFPFSSSKRICSYALESHLRSRCNLGSS